MPKIKIAFVIDTIASPTAGTEKQLILLLKHLDRNRFEPYLCCLQPSNWLVEEFNLCPVHIIGIRSFKNLISYIQLWGFSKFLKERKIDIVQTYFRDANIVGIISGKLAGVKIIISTRRNLGYWHNKMEIIILKFLNRWVKRFVANSEYARNHTNRIEGVPFENIEVIYNFIDQREFKRGGKQEVNKLKESFGIANGHPTVTMVANLRPVKGVDVFLKSARLVLNDIPDVNFIIAGDGEQRQILENICHQLGINKSVKLIGTVSDVVSLLNISDIGVLSSYSESLSNSIIEYMATGLPVVCTDVGGNRELVQDGRNGFFVPPNDPQRLADAIVKLIKDPDLRLKMGRESLNLSEKLFDFESTLKQYENLFLKLIE
jgi:glycosyltransferase involved in cell wall biosynthesis